MWLKVCVASIAGTGKASYIVCTDSMIPAVQQALIVSIVSCTFINILASGLGMNSIAKEACLTVSIGEAANLIITTEMIPGVADSVATVVS